MSHLPVRTSCCVGTVKTNLEVVSAPKAAARIGKEDLLERKREIKTLILQQFSEVLYAVLNPLGLFPDSKGKYKGKTLLARLICELYQDHRDPKNGCKCSEILCSALMKPSDLAGA